MPLSDSKRKIILSNTEHTRRMTFIRLVPIFGKFGQTHLSLVSRLGVVAFHIRPCSDQPLENKGTEPLCRH